MDKFHDSAGVAWEGREFSTNPFSDDDGSTPQALAIALSESPASQEKLFLALQTSRLLVPLLAELGEPGLGPFGKVVDKSAELSVVAVSTPDGQTALPAFSCVEQMSLWNKNARPVPIAASRVALAAIGEGHSRVILDPAGQSIGLRRPFLASLAQQKLWSAPHQNLSVARLIEKAAAKNQILGLTLLDGDPSSNLRSAELLIELQIEPGLSKAALDERLANFSSDLQSQQFLELVDSIAYRVVSAS
jgi:hypothetical protein